MHSSAPLAPRWQHVHADWWQDDRGNDIHRVEIDDEALYHCHLAGSPLPWDAVARSLDQAMAVVEENRGRVPIPCCGSDASALRLQIAKEGRRPSRQ